MRPERPLVIRAGNFWDGISDCPVGPQEILVKGETIAEIGTSIDTPVDADVIDLPDSTIMPGLIDCHVHLTLRPELTGCFWSYSPSYKALLGAEALTILLSNGFTTVRDCGDMDLHGFTVRDLKTATVQGMIPGPRVICSGHMISSRGGHMNATRALSPDSGAWENCLADGIDEIRKVVRREIRWGADWVKFAASGGFSSAGDDPCQVTYSQEEMDAIVETARDFNRQVSVHVIGDEATRRAVLAGVRSIEHASMASQETIALIAQQGAWLCPTQLAAVKSARLVGDDAYWHALNVPAHVRQKMRKYQDSLLDNARQIAKSDVKIAFGTDLGILPYRINGACEFSEMVTNGIAPLRALKAATSEAAALLQRDDIGVLAPARCADIVAVPGDPFRDITVMEKVEFVMNAGTVWKQERCTGHRIR